MCSSLATPWKQWCWREHGRTPPLPGAQQTLGDPWAEVEQKFPAGSAIEGPVRALLSSGLRAVGGGVEGMVHVSEITAESMFTIRRMCSGWASGEAQVLEVDKAKRQLRLSMKQRTSVTVDEYLAEHRWAAWSLAGFSRLPKGWPGWN